jgi:diguanylate cyclase (GGDEF)-like protein
MSILMIDVDYFKKLNDQHGHMTGDQILMEIGFLIKASIREIDIAGRYGGEEFCVILPDTDRQGAQYAAERIRQATEQAVIKAYDTSVKVTVSIGTATFPKDGNSTDELIDKADWALYRAKKRGRNVVCSFGVYHEDEQATNGGNSPS